MERSLAPFALTHQPESDACIHPGHCGGWVNSGLLDGPLADSALGVTCTITWDEVRLRTRTENRSGVSGYFGEGFNVSD